VCAVRAQRRRRLQQRQQRGGENDVATGQHT
jgi:hypothetical protein